MDIILLSGRPNSGKTTTMNLVYHDLAAQGATAIVQRTQVGGNPSDFECVLVYKGKRIAIFSMGDYLNECWTAVVKYAYCDKLILAYNNKFTRNLATIAGSCHNHVIVPKTHGNATISNQADAANILAHI